MDDSELQSEPIVFRVMDHDLYSSDDLIGTVSIGLNPLLHRLEGDNLQIKAMKRVNTSGAAESNVGGGTEGHAEEGELDMVEQGGGSNVHTIQGWYPIYDTLEGVRGKLYIVIKVQFFGDENPFKESSASVKFFMGSVLEPSVFEVESLIGFVEELVVENDPEYEWSDNFRSSRKSNESRQLLLYRLSNTVRRLVGKKARELGANAVIGYEQHFDVEGDSGLVARGFGTACIVRTYSGFWILGHTNKHHSHSLPLQGRTLSWGKLHDYFGRLPPCQIYILTTRMDTRLGELLHRWSCSEARLTLASLRTILKAPRVKVC